MAIAVRRSFSTLETVLVPFLITREKILSYILLNFILPFLQMKRGFPIVESLFWFIPYNPAFSFNAAALSVFSHGTSMSVRPK